MLYECSNGKANPVMPSCPTYEMRWFNHYTMVEIKLGSSVIHTLNPKDFHEDTDLLQVAADFIAKRKGTPDHFYIAFRQPTLMSDELRIFDNPSLKPLILGWTYNTRTKVLVSHWSDGLNRDEKVIDFTLTNLLELVLNGKAVERTGIPFTPSVSGKTTEDVDPRKDLESDRHLSFRSQRPVTSPDDMDL